MKPLSPSRLEQKPNFLRKMLVLSGVKTGGLVLLFVGLVGFMVVHDRKRIEKEQYTWDTVSAQVTESRKNGTGKRASCYFLYEYFAGGQALEGSLYSIRDWNSCEGVKQFEVGDVLDVYYDPDNPNDTVAIREDTSVLTLYPMYFAMLATAGMGFYATFMMSYAKACRLWQEGREGAKRKRR